MPHGLRGAFKERGRSPTRRAAGGDFFMKVPTDASTDESVDRDVNPSDEVS